ncbi:MAG TPA: DUF885 domain-containing protein [Streptosporangiaceae bacterium]|nr:DUF885 domain-containing protein [Streptosporangiaceae bacterium]
MPDITPTGESTAKSKTPRAIADRYVAALAELDPLLATRLGIGQGEDRLPDLTPAGHEAVDALDRSALIDLADGQPADDDDRRCARLLRERLEARLAMSAHGEQLRQISNLFGPPQRVRSIFLDMPAKTSDDWAVIASRMSKVPQALTEYRASLAAGLSQGLIAGPKVVSTVIGQLGDWAAADGGKGWFAQFAAGAAGAGVPDSLRAALDDAARSAAQAVARLTGWLRTDYLPRAATQPDGVGEERYKVSARLFTGANLDLAEAYSWGWSQYLELRKQMRQEAERIVPGASAREAMDYLNANGEAVEGVDAIRAKLQQMMDDAIADLDGTHFDIAAPVRTVEARIAPEGSAAAPYYTAPSNDFSRPGRTCLPTLGRTRFPLWNLVSTWYHEGVPGHHLQMAQWRYLSGQLSVYQTSVGMTSACGEGWALYAERLMDELGYLTGPGHRLSYLDAQMARAIRVVIDIGMHTAQTIPAGSPVGAGQTWTPELAREFFGMHSGRPAAFLDSEIIRYLSAPGQAISYKLGERGWLAGRDAARAAHAARGEEFDLKAWHMAALSLGSLGLDDLTDELAKL